MGDYLFDLRDLSVMDAGDELVFEIGDVENATVLQASDIKKLHSALAVWLDRPRPMFVNRDLLESLLDPTHCYFDHHGDCQGHGFVLASGEVCPQRQLKELLAGGG